MNSLNTTPPQGIPGTASKTGLPVLKQLGMGKDKVEMEIVDGLQVDKRDDPKS